MPRRRNTREADRAIAPTRTPLDQSRVRGLTLLGITIYLVWTGTTIGLRPEHFLIAVVFGALFWSARTTDFAVRALPFLMVGILYDNVRLVTHLRGTIHVDDLYAAELAWFSIPTAAGRQILPFVLENYTHPLVDFISGITYLLYLPQTFICAGVLFFIDRQRLTHLGWAFVVVNLMGIATWLIYPAAPPWYVQDYGLGPAILDAPASAAGTARFDALFDIQLFEQFYARSANVFGAMPSLHCAYPALVFLVVRTMGPRWSIPAALFAALMSFSAVYLQHHYVWDVVAGIAYAAVGYYFVGFLRARLAHRTPPDSDPSSADARSSSGQSTSSIPNARAPTSGPSLRHLGLGGGPDRLLR